MKNDMKKINIKLVAVSAMLLGSLSSCNDIVTYNDNYDDGMTSTGAPVINMVYYADDTEKTAPIVSAEFEEMLVLEGENLSHVTKVLFNDVELPVSEVYATAKNAYLPVPRKVPGEVTDKIYYTTELGETSYDFKVVIPEVRVEGLYNEYCEPGDTVQIVGDYFDLYGFDGSVETSKVTMNGETLKVDSVSEYYFSVVIPENAQPKSLINIDYEGVNGHVNRQIVFRNADSFLFDLDDPEGSNISKTDYITDGSNTDDPEPIDGKSFVRITGEFGSWAWTTWLNGNVAIPQDVVDNPSEYVFKFEISCPASVPVYSGGYNFKFDSAQYTWNFDNQNGLNTEGKWRTVTLDFEGMNPGTSELKYFDFAISAPGLTWTVDHSFANFRIEKKLQ